jgi:uncharacterized protein YbaP (TraB family)
MLARPALASALLAPVLLAPVLLAAAPGPAFADPALWVARDADSTMYLFGSVHALAPGMAWRTPAVGRALDESREVWVETTELEDPAAIQAAFRAYGLDPTRALSSRLSGEEQRALAAALALTGVPPDGLEPMRPWLAMLVLSTASIAAAGFDPALGPDRTILAEARAAGTPVRGLETVATEVRLLAGMPEATGMVLLRQAVAEAETGGGIADIARLWLGGDLPGLEALLFGDPDATPAEIRTFHRLLFAERNRAWAEVLRRRLDGRGTSFVVVGAGHLAGPDSLLELLEAAGVRVDRIE